MHQEETLQIVTEFFRVHPYGASLKLPNGWFGRPYDNLHQLTSAKGTDGSVVIILDGQQSLSLEGQLYGEVVSNDILRLAGFSRAVWDWIEYGPSGKAHHEQFEGGVVEFLIPPG